MRKAREWLKIAENKIISLKKIAIAQLRPVFLAFTHFKLASLACNEWRGPSEAVATGGLLGTKPPRMYF